MTPAISVENLGKSYRVHHAYRQFGYRATLRDTLVEMVKAPWRRLRRGPLHDQTEEFWALKNISFDIEQGEVVGVIGRNGAGKSTLLKILSQITKPTTGEARFRGRVGSLLEVGTGFHPELTGRENIYLNGGILGMSRREINRNFNDIVAFAEISKFLDTPVKRYSSGMYVRLAFAVAAHLRPEILVVDEVLAVGDTAFQKKCLGKMGEVSRSGRTVILVSHNMASILNLCQKVVVLEQGNLVFMGPCDKGVEHYMKIYDATRGAEIDLTDHPNRRPGSRPFFKKVRLRNGAGRLTDEFLCGEPMTIEFVIDPTVRIPNFDIELRIDDTFGVPLVTSGPYFSENGPLTLNGQQRLVCQLEQLPLIPGKYCLSFDASPYNQASVDALDQAVIFTVVEADFFGTGKLPDASRARFVLRSRWHAEDI
jgi:lipopolysaccharide transport system ATP-binding protein